MMLRMININCELVYQKANNSEKNKDIYEIQKDLKSGLNT